MTRSSGLPGAVLLAAAALLAWGSAALLLRQEFRQVTGEATKSIATMMVQDEHRLRQRTLQAENQVLFFAATPPVAGIGRALLNNGLDPADGTPLAQWRARLEQIARAYVAAHAEVLSMCLIGVADGGREVVRVHRNTAGTVTVVAPGELQQKGDRPYFTAAVRLPEGAVYLSPVELNQEHGRIELPARPTLRAAMPVRNARGEVFGVVVLNTAAQPLLDAIATPDLPDVTEWVTDAAGQYLWHPQPGKALAHELAPPGTTWQQEFPAAPEAQTVAPIGGLPAGTAHATRRASDGADWQMLTRTLRAPDASGAGGLVLHSGIPVAVLQARAWDSVRGQLLQVWAMGLFVIGLLVFMLLRWRGTPLGLTLEAEAGAPGRTLRLFGVELPLTATGHRPRWQVVTAALLPVLWWGVLQLVVGNQEMKHPFIVMLLPVLVASWWGGLFAGLAASLLAVVGAWNLVTDSPLMNWGSYGELISDVGAVVGAATLLLTGMLVTFTQEAVRRRAAQLVVSERAARERERRLVEQAPVSLAMFDTEMRYLAASARWKTDFSLPPDEDLTGRSYYEILPEIPERWQEVHRRVLAGETLSAREDNFERADGAAQVMDWECKPWRTPAGAIGGLILWSEDVTSAVNERHAAEAGLRNLTERLRQRLAERETLLQEVHHRVKNNLQVISSLLSLQQQRTDSARVVEELQTIHDRIMAIALVHEQLYDATEFDRLELAAFIRQLGGNILGASNAAGRVGLTVRGEGFPLDLQQAVPCALLVNELITNAIKHAFPYGRVGRITVEVGRNADGTRQVVVSDDGVGVEHDDGAGSPVTERLLTGKVSRTSAARLAGKSLGLQLVEGFARQLLGTLERLPQEVGTGYRVTLPAEKAEEQPHGV